MTCPCKDCIDRFIDGTVTCHSFCKKYVDWKEKRTIELNAITEKKKKEFIIDNYMMKKQIRINKSILSQKSSNKGRRVSLY